MCVPSVPNTSHIKITCIYVSTCPGPVPNLTPGRSKMFASTCRNLGLWHLIESHALFSTYKEENVTNMTQQGCKTCISPLLETQWRELWVILLQCMEHEHLLNTGTFKLLNAKLKEKDYEFQHLLHNVHLQCDSAAEEISELYHLLQYGLWQNAISLSENSMRVLTKYFCNDTVSAHVFIQYLIGTPSVMFENDQLQYFCITVLQKCCKPFPDCDVSGRSQSECLSAVISTSGLHKEKGFEKLEQWLLRWYSCQERTLQKLICYSLTHPKPTLLRALARNHCEEPAECGPIPLEEAFALTVRSRQHWLGPCMERGMWRLVGGSSECGSGADAADLWLSAPGPLLLLCLGAWLDANTGSGANSQLGRRLHRLHLQHYVRFCIANAAAVRVQSAGSDPALQQLCVMLGQRLQLLDWCQRQGSALQRRLLRVSEHTTTLHTLWAAMHLAQADWVQVRALLSCPGASTLVDAQLCEEEKSLSPACTWAVSAFDAFCVLMLCFRAIQQSVETAALAGAGEASVEGAEVCSVEEQLARVQHTLCALQPLHLRLEVLENVFSLLFLQSEADSEDSESDSSMEEGAVEEGLPDDNSRRSLVSSVASVGAAVSRERGPHCDSASRRGFLCSRPLVAQILGLVQSCVQALQPVPEALRRRTDRLARCVEEAGWRLQLLPAAGHSPVMSMPRWQGSGPRTRRTSGVSGGGGGCLLGAAPAPRATSCVAQMLSSAPSLVVQCLARGQLQRAKEVLQVLKVGSPLLDDVLFSDALQQLRGELGRGVQLSPAPASPAAPDSSSSPAPLLQSVKQAATEGVFTAWLTRRVGIFLSSAPLMSLPALQHLVAELPAVEVLVGVAGSGGTLTLLELLLTASATPEHSSSLLQLLEQCVEQCVLPCSAPVPGCLLFVRSLVDSLQAVGREQSSMLPCLERCRSLMGLLQSPLLAGPCAGLHCITDCLRFWRELAVGTAACDAALWSTEELQAQPETHPEAQLEALSQLAHLTCFPQTDRASQEATGPELGLEPAAGACLARMQLYLSAVGSCLWEQWSLQGLCELLLGRSLGRSLAALQLQGPSASVLRRGLQPEALAHAVSHNLVHSVACLAGLGRLQPLADKPLPPGHSWLVLNRPPVDVECMWELEPQLDAAELAAQLLGSLLAELAELAVLTELPGPGAVLDGSRLREAASRPAVQRSLAAAAALALSGAEPPVARAASLAFLINATNLATLHALLTAAEPGLGLITATTAGYRLGPWGFVSLEALRAALGAGDCPGSTTAPRGALQALSGLADPRARFAVAVPDRWTPRIQVMHADQLDQQLNAAVAEYLGACWPPVHLPSFLRSQRGCEAAEAGDTPEMQWLAAEPSQPVGERMASVLQSLAGQVQWLEPCPEELVRLAGSPLSAEQAVTSPDPSALAPAALAFLEAQCWPLAMLAQLPKDEGDCSWREMWASLRRLDAMQRSGPQSSLALQAMREAVLLQLVCSTGPYEPGAEPWQVCLQLEDGWLAAECTLQRGEAWPPADCERVLKALLGDQALTLLPAQHTALVQQLQRVQVQGRASLQWEPPDDGRPLPRLQLDAAQLLILLEAQALDAGAIEQLLFALPPEETFAACAGALEQAAASPGSEDVRASQTCAFLAAFLSEWESAPLLPPLAERCTLLALGARLLQLLPASVRAPCAPLVTAPHLILEQLLMNSQFRALDRVLGALQPALAALPPASPVALARVDTLLRMYAEQALECRVRHAAPTARSATPAAEPNSDSAPDLDPESPPEPTLELTSHQFVMPEKVPSKGEWMRDDEVAECLCCRAVVFSMFNRRHHCRRCGRVVCTGCSSQRLPVAGYSGVRVRVCTACVEQMQVVRATAEPQGTSGLGLELGPRLESQPWRLALDPVHNATLRDEFSFEHAPSVPLCLSVLQPHSDQPRCARFLMRASEQLLELLQPLASGELNPEVDSSLVLRMVRSLLVAAKLKFSRALLPAAVAQCDGLLQLADALAVLLEAGCTPELAAPLLAAPGADALRPLRDSLLALECWPLAAQLSAKSGLDPAAVWAAWGRACLRAGRWAYARDHFARCLAAPGVGTAPGAGVGAAAGLARPFADHPLLQEVLQLLDAAGLGAAQQQVPGPGQVPGRELDPEPVLRRLAGLQDVAQGQFSPGAVTAASAPPQRVYTESLHYLQTYGSTAALLRFMVTHGALAAALQLVLQQRVEPELFLHAVYMRCLARGRGAALLHELAAADPSLCCWQPYLHHVCGHLERRRLLHALLQLQLFLRDRVRAAITCVLFYTTGCRSYSEMARRHHYLAQAQALLEEEVAAAYHTSVSSWPSADPALGPSLTVTGTGALHMDTRQLHTHLGTARRQAEVTRFLQGCEARGCAVPMLAAELCGRSSPTSTPAAAASLPTLFGSAHERVLVAVLAILSGQNVEEGFGIAFRVVQDYRMRVERVARTAARSLARGGRLADVQQLVGCVRQSGEPQPAPLCDTVLMAALQALPATQCPAAVVSLLAEITDVPTKISALIECQQLKAAYLLAVKHDRIDDVLRIWHEAKRLGMTSIQKICATKLNIPP